LVVIVNEATWAWDNIGNSIDAIVEFVTNLWVFVGEVAVLSWALNGGLSRFCESRANQQYNFQLESSLKDAAPLKRDFVHPFFLSLSCLITLAYFPKLNLNHLIIQSSFNLIFSEKLPMLFLLI